MRLDLNDPQVWDKWREQYYDLTNEQQLEFANACADRFPSQEHHNLECFRTLFRDHVKPGAQVLEVGGWKGELARKCMAEFDIKTWTNIEFCHRAAQQTVPMDPLRGAYNVMSPVAFDWFMSPPLGDTREDVFVSAHTIEHFSASHLEGLLRHVAGIPIVMLEAPIGDGPSNWSGYMGTHKLESGWTTVDWFMVRLGYSFEAITPMCHLYKLVSP